MEIEKLELLQPEFYEVQINFAHEILPKTIYQLVLKNIYDCYGNVLKESWSTFVLAESADSIDLIINEILFNPLHEGVDFVEKYNQSEKYIDLNSISLEIDGFEPISLEPFIIEPKQFLAITEDPILLNNHYPGIVMKNALKSINIPAYNDDQGNVVLADFHGKIIDFFHYDEEYHSALLNEVEGVSLKRISFSPPSNDPVNWQSASSTAGYATPGKLNSQFLLSGNESDEVTVDPAVFDPATTVSMISQQLNAVSQIRATWPAS